MAADPLTALVDAIAESGLLTSEKMGELRRLAILSPDDPQGVARQIVQRGWLTAFQVKTFWKGRGKDLLLGSYILVDKVGEGGMGEVFRAQHRHMGRDVALKVIRREKLANPEAVSRFRQEVMAAAQLSHPNVVMTYDADTDGERHFLAMEFVEGMTLTEKVRDQGPLSIRDACDTVRQAALGLQHAFEKGLVHRDIKPSNLLLTARGNQVKILDMGLARWDAPNVSEDDLRITQEGFLIGTPDFIAPEQARNARKADIRADIYALGGTLYFLLTGQVPYPNGTATEKLVRHATEPVPDANRFRRDLPPLLQAIMARMMAKKPEDRFQTPAEVAAALDPFCRPPTTVTVPAPATQRMPAVPATTAELVQGIASAPIADPSTQTRFRLPPPPPPGRPAHHAPQRSNIVAAISVAAGIGVLFLAGVVWMTLGNAPVPTTTEFPEELRFENHLRMLFARIEPGTFSSGTDEDEPNRSKVKVPGRELHITRPFYMATTEVTQGQYAKLMGKNPAKSIPPRDAESWPVETVTWTEATAFCAALNESDSRKRPGFVYRLPTEAEWEYACLAGQKTPFGFGDKLTSGRNAHFDSTKDTELIEGSPTKPKGPTRAGRMLVNAFGLSDMNGNVWEWCADWYDDRSFDDGANRDPRGPNEGTRRVVKGGAWNTSAGRCRCSNRKGLPPDSKSNDLGFRVVWGPA